MAEIILSAAARTLVHYHLSAKITRIEPEGEFVVVHYEVVEDHPVKCGSFVVNQDGAVHFETGQEIGVSISRE